MRYRQFRLSASQLSRDTLKLSGESVLIFNACKNGAEENKSQFGICLWFILDNHPHRISDVNTWKEHILKDINPVRELMQE